MSVPLEHLTDEERALTAVLLFFASTPGDADKRLDWWRLTGQTEATSRVLCDTVRRVLRPAAAATP